jgi:hypothetical protein
LKILFNSVFKEQESFSVDGRNVVFYQGFITLACCIYMIVTAIMGSKAFEYAVFYILPTALIGFVYYNPRSVKMSQYIKDNYSQVYNEFSSRSWRFVPSGLVILNPAWIPEDVVNSIPDPDMKIMIREMKYYRKLLKNSVIAFILFYFILGIITGLQINKVL